MENKAFAVLDPPSSGQRENYNNTANTHSHHGGRHASCVKVGTSDRYVNSLKYNADDKCE